MSKYRHLTLEELLFRCEDAALHSPLIAELVQRIRFPEVEEESDKQPRDEFHDVTCPVCESKLEIEIFVEEFAPRLTKAAL